MSTLAMNMSPHSDDAKRRQKARSLAIALALLALVAIFYAATIVRLGPNVLNKDGFATVGAKKNIIIEDETRNPAACKKAGTC